MYNASRFSTLRFWHVNNEKQEIRKTIIDLSRVGEQHMRGKMFNVHRGIPGFCANNLWNTTVINSFFLVNHYPLTFEQYGFRKGDARGRINYEDWIKRYQQNAKPIFDTNDMVRGWLHKFLDEVGTKDAQTLLRGVGELVGGHQDLLGNYLTSLSFHNCDHYNHTIRNCFEYFNKAKKKF